ncbi:MAG: YggT family protein [Actinomycetia bacterium]|nr:YggT family protein [Actinomycetes bacterium]
MAIVCPLLNLYLFVMFIYIVLSWFRPRYGTAPAKIHDALGTVVEPVLSPIRQALRPMMGSLPLDLSPMVVVFGILIVRGVLRCG